MRIDSPRVLSLTIPATNSYHCWRLQRKLLRTKSVAKYEKDIQDLKDMLKQKTDECYQSWMSWTEANEQLQKIRMDLDNKTFQTYSLGKNWYSDFFHLLFCHTYLGLFFLIVIFIFPLSRIPLLWIIEP